MKKLLTALLIVLYFSSIYICLKGKYQFYIIIISMITVGILSCLNIINAVCGTKKLRTDYQKQKIVNQFILIVKLMLIPFFIFMFIIVMDILSILRLTDGRTVLLLVCIFFLYTILLATSSYTISLLFALYKNDILTHRKFILHSWHRLIWLLTSVIGVIMFFA